MNSLLIVFGFMLILLTLSLSIGYIIAKRVLGAEVAQQNLKKSSLWLFPGLIIIALAILIAGPNSFSNIIVCFHFLYVVVSIILICFHFRKIKNNTLLLNLGRTSQSKLFLWVGLFEAIVTMITIWYFILHFSSEMPLDIRFWEELSRPFFWGTLSANFILLGLSNLELRNQGIRSAYSFIAWHRVMSYGWERSKTNVLTIKFKPFLPFLPGVMTLPIPTKHYEAVSQILETKLPDKQRV